MSSYDPSSKPELLAGKGLETAREAQHGNGATRQQLPSLSSLFGPPSQMRPLNSPLSERPSPLYSPLDRPQSASATRERSISSSYFPNVPGPATQPRSGYDPRLEQERPPLPPAALQFPGPLSPRHRELGQAAADRSSGSRWTSQPHPHEARRPEYVFGNRDHGGSFRAVNERLSYPPLINKSSHDLSSAAQHQMQGGGAIRSPASSVSGVSEGITGKDGLGPKIWTGTHFLPRFLRSAEVPGEGLCYFYDDGTHCKTVIDGEQVNAHWGVTKAGKPRKRLAIACLTCREKKIKCDPDFPRCVQCDKFGRVCKFKNAPRGGNTTSPVTSPVETDEPRQLGPLQQRPNELKRPRSASSTSGSTQTTTIAHQSPEVRELSTKRMRLSHDTYPPLGGEPARLYQASDAGRPHLPSWHRSEDPRIRDDAHHRPWHTEQRSHAPI